jgi:hypothetical protein
MPDDASNRPTKITEVPTWLEAHPAIDPAVLAPYPRQRAAERRAALRALGRIATPAALEILASYARPGYSDVDLDELHRMWGSFDRREFAARMFRPSPLTLNLGVTKSLEGIGAVPDLTSLDVIFLGEADLEPLRECVSLHRLKIISNLTPSITSVGPLTQLPELRSLQLNGVTRHADLSLLSTMPITHMKISLDGADGSFLLAMPQLRTVIISGGASPCETQSSRASAHPKPLPAHDGLREVILALVRSGVDVVVYTHERAWVTPLVEAAETTAGVFVDEVAGRFSLTTEESRRDRLRTRLRLNTIEP